MFEKIGGQSREAGSVVKDRQVKILEPGNHYEAYALGINDTGELIVEKEDGSVQNIFAGEVSVRGIYGYT